MSGVKQSSSNRFSVLANLQAEKWRLYRAILDVFRSERERFVEFLRRHL